MHTVGAAVTGRVARLVLLTCTLLGLTAMHTIGHHGVTRAFPADTPAVATHDSPDARLPVMVVMGAYGDCPGGDCAHLSAPPTHPGSGMPDLGLCVAVLSAFAVAVLLAALLLAALTGSSLGGPGTARRVAGPRAPPARPVGLVLAAGSVLRT